MSLVPKWGSQGEAIYNRTYSRQMSDGTQEEWHDTVRRVVSGNLALVHGTDESQWPVGVLQEAVELCGYMYDFALIPAGRHLWATGVPGQQYLSNCHVAGWTDRLSDHTSFMLLRLMEGGGVGSNYSSVGRPTYRAPSQRLDLHLILSDDHPDYASVSGAGLLSPKYGQDWTGAFEVRDSREGWAEVCADLIDTFYRGDVSHRNRVYDLTHVRAAGSRLKRFGGAASGPLPLAELMTTIAAVLNNRHHNQASLGPLHLMKIDHAIAQAVVAGGVRRSARMSIVHWADPSIVEFINCKSDTGEHWTTNISVEIDGAFISGLDEPDSAASKVHAAVVAGMYRNGEPGYWNSELSNVGEPNRVTCTNPCGEIALQDFENCNLGHINLEAFVPVPGKEQDSARELVRAHRLMTRFLMRATFGDFADPKQKAVQDRNRRIGVGHLGVQAYIARCGMKYSDVPDSTGFPTLLDMLYKIVRKEAREYSFQLRIPEPVKVTTVAPTGTVAKLPGTTEGIAPIYAKHYVRRVRFSSTHPEQIVQVDRLRAEGYEVEDCVYAPNTVVVAFPCEERLLLEVGSPDLVESADELSIDQLLAFQAMYQEHFADNAVSFTVNFDPSRLSERELSNALKRWLPGLKGTTVMSDGSRPQAPYTRISKEQFDAMTAPKGFGTSNDEDCGTGACPIR